MSGSHTCHTFVTITVGEIKAKGSVFSGFSIFITDMQAGSFGLVFLPQCVYVCACVCVPVACFLVGPRHLEIISLHVQCTKKLTAIHLTTKYL